MDLVSQGSTATNACKVVGLDAGKFWREKAKRPSLEVDYERARQAQVEYYLDRIVTIADDEKDQQKAKNIADNLKWAVTKLNPRKYGDRMDITVNTSIDLVSAIEQGKDRMRSVCDQQSEPIELTPDKSGTYVVSPTDSTSDAPKMPDIFG